MKLNFVINANVFVKTDKKETDDEVSSSGTEDDDSRESIKINFEEEKLKAPNHNCRSTYNNSKMYDGVERFPVEDNQVSWDVKFENYAPKYYSAKVLETNPIWADPMDPNVINNWNSFDQEYNVDRKSFHGEYKIVNTLLNGISFHVPRNPIGRTGIVGRGKLGKWGPNHAADPIVTRWKLDKNKKFCKSPKSGKLILQFAAIQRNDANERGVKNEWAIPGGMCDPGEKISQTLQREFNEETQNHSEKDKQRISNNMDKVFKEQNSVLIYQGYVDDPRNTDNSWMETQVYNFHDGEYVLGELSAGDDARHAKWIDIDQNLKLYASHKDFIERVANHRGAHW